MNHIKVIIRDSESNAIIETLADFSTMEEAFNSIDEYWKNLSEEDLKYTEAEVVRINDSGLK